MCVHIHRTPEPIAHVSDTPETIAHVPETIAHAILPAYLLPAYASGSCEPLRHSWSGQVSLLRLTALYSASSLLHAHQTSVPCPSDLHRLLLGDTARDRRQALISQSIPGVRLKAGKEPGGAPGFSLHKQQQQP